MILWGWNYYRFKSQLQKILIASPDTKDLASSLSAVSLVRREILYLQQQCQQQTETLQQQQQILDLLPIGYLHIDQDNQLLWCNPQAQQLLKLDRWQPGQVRLLLELVRSYELDQQIQRTRQRQTPQTKEWVFYPPNYDNQLLSGDRPISISLKASSYPLKQGEVAVFLENQQPLLELSQSRDRAFSDLTHELRTPLTAISLVAETLQNRLENPERRWINQLLSETQRLIKLVEDWLDLSQLGENHSQTLTCESLDLGELIQSAWQSLAPLAQKTQVTLNFRELTELTFSGDRARLFQVFLNIFDNSLKHSPPNGVIEVTLQLTPDDQSIQIDIIDQGSGFLEKDLPYIFDRLYRGEPSRVRQGTDPESRRQGSGLGLAIALEIIKAHGGNITAKNHPETGGGWIQLILPLQRV
ncbi:histidine kinase [Rippkaea orientalis PCC 8801]|uniref:histidine kinase n=1 Tax=Rippkaea orientalis (strain PCC 8801 / RF-1) TaxID=41431 RepID=B7K0E2_RIPO1|nr:HAMP domain-containing sensor histidine kinase [Rippkaea orientalis]ACK67426.1 histidine kinase [Rippkaea orientalis PCC 8801]